MTTSWAVSRESTAVLCTDYQQDIVGTSPADRQHEILQKAGRVLVAARRAQLPAIYLDSFMHERAQRYMKRRHPRKSGWWRTQKYWGRTIGRQDRWVFQDKDRYVTLRKFAWTPIVRHRLVPTTYSPDDPTLQDYWRQRWARPHAMAYRQQHLAQRQHGRCPVCHQHLENGEALHTHHVVPKHHGGTEDLANLRLVHANCHRQIHSTSAPLGVRRLLEPCTG